MIRDVNSAFSPDQSVFNCCGVRAAYVSLALRRRRPAYRSAIFSPVYESSFWTSEKVYEASHNLRYQLLFAVFCVVLDKLEMVECKGEARGFIAGIME